MRALCLGLLGFAIRRKKRCWLAEAVSPSTETSASESACRCFHAGRTFRLSRCENTDCYRTPRGRIQWSKDTYLEGKISVASCVTFHTCNWSYPLNLAIPSLLFWPIALITSHIREFSSDVINAGFPSYYPESRQEFRKVRTSW